MVRLIRIPWSRYYYRVIGFAILGAGSGLVVDELINGPFRIGIADHETWGLAMIIAGAIFIARKPQGK